jgi:hypothetical protein
VLFALKELGESLKIVGVDLFKGEQRTPAFTALNPMQKVPVTEDGGRLETRLKKGAPYAYVGDGGFKVVDGEILELASADERAGRA